MPSSVVSIISCLDYTQDNIRPAVKKSFDNLGGLKKWVKKGHKVLVKPNLLSAREPEKAVTTHPALVQAVVEEVQKLGAKAIIGDSPGGVEKGIHRVWNNTGMAEVAKNTGAELLSFEKSGVVEKKAPSGKTYWIAKPSAECDVIISLPKLKRIAHYRVRAIMQFNQHISAVRKHNHRGCMHRTFRHLPRRFEFIDDKRR